MRTIFAAIILSAFATYAVAVTGGVSHFSERVHATLALPGCSATVHMMTPCDPLR